MRNEAFQFFNLEKGMAFTYVALVKNPFETIKTYLNFDRRKYTNPLRFLLFSIAVYVLILNISPSFQSLGKFTEKRNIENFAPLEKKFNIPIAASLAKAQKIYTSNQSVVYLFFIPLISLITFWFFKPKYNYAENLAINAFMFGTTNWTSALLSLLTIFIEMPFYLIFLLLLVSLLITSYLYKNIYKISWGISFVTTLLVYFIVTFLGVIVQFSLAAYLMFSAT